MNSLEKRIKEGLEIIHVEGITLTVFKKQMSELFTNPKAFDEDEWVANYRSYAFDRAQYKTSIQEWAKYFFQEWKDEIHGNQLK
jgi:hypothetical protein